MNSTKYSPYWDSKISNMKRLFFLLMLAVMTLGTKGQSDPPADVIQSDRDALIAIYDALDGDNWTNKTNWKAEGIPVEDWYGVTVTGDRVTGLNLRVNNLRGEFPDELTDLTELIDLDLEQNVIYGNLPASIGNWTKLQFWDMYGTQLSGEIPEEIGQCTALRSLALSGQRSNSGFSWHDESINSGLSGNIPASITNLSNAYLIYLWGNFLTGPIPSDIGALTELEHVSWSQNDLTGTIPSSIGDLENLRLLYLWGNELTGEIPNSITNLVNLTDLDLGINNFTGQIPQNIGNMRSLQYLSLGGNDLTGAVPSSIGDIRPVVEEGLLVKSGLQELYLWSNQFTSLPESLGDIESLQWLDISGNNLSGELIETKV
jgi:hypothetical protein